MTTSILLLVSLFPTSEIEPARQIAHDVSAKCEIVIWNAQKARQNDLYSELVQVVRTNEKRTKPSLKRNVVAIAEKPPRRIEFTKAQPTIATKPVVAAIADKPARETKNELAVIDLSPLKFTIESDEEGFDRPEPDFVQVAEAWPHLPLEIRTQILQLAKSVE